MVEIAKRQREYIYVCSAMTNTSLMMLLWTPCTPRLAADAAPQMPSCTVVMHTSPSAACIESCQCTECASADRQHFRWTPPKSFRPFCNRGDKRQKEDCRNPCSLVPDHVSNLPTKMRAANGAVCRPLQRNGLSREDDGCQQGVPGCSTHSRSRVADEGKSGEQPENGVKLAFTIRRTSICNRRRMACFKSFRPLGQQATHRHRLLPPSVSAWQRRSSVPDPTTADTQQSHAQRYHRRSEETMEISKADRKQMRSDDRQWR